MWFMYGLKGAYLRNFSEIKKVRGNLFFHGLSYYIAIETYALKLSRSSAWEFWMYAE